MLPRTLLHEQPDSGQISRAKLEEDGDVQSEETDFGQSIFGFGVCHGGAQRWGPKSRKTGAPKGGAPNGGGPKSRKSRAPKGGARKGGGPKNRAFSSLCRSHFALFLSLFVGALFCPALQLVQLRTLLPGASGADGDTPPLHEVERTFASLL